MIKYILLTLLVAFGAMAQDGPTVVPTEGPANTAYQYVSVVSGTNIVAMCYAKSTDPLRVANVISISAGSNASPVVLTSVGHGFSVYALPKVTIAGATGGWAGINGTWTATPLDADTFTIPVNSSAFPVGILGTVTFTTTAPRTNVKEWGVERLIYNGSNVFVWRGWLNGAVRDSKCDDALSTTVPRQ